MRIRAKYQLITATLIISVVVSIAAMVIHTQRKVLREQTMQRLEAMLEGAARIAKESFDGRDRLMAVSYLMFLQKTYPELASASVSFGGHVSKIGEENRDLLYLSRNVPSAAGPAQSGPDVPAAGSAASAGIVVCFGFVRGSIEGEVNRALAPLIRWTAWIAGGFLFLGLIINAWVTRLLIGPIEALAQATSLLASGQLNVSVPVRTNDEVGTLTRGFNSMAARLRELLESREDILHTLTHEINTPLSGLKGYLELWQDEKIPHDTKKTAEIQGTMMAAVLRMENSLGNALKLFRGEDRLRSGGEDQIVMLDMIFKQTITIFLPMAQANGIRILPLHESFKGYVMAPEELIRQIISNLVSNAIKYTPRGGEVSVGLMETDDEVMFHVRNSGRGIPAEDIPHLFTKFYRSTQDREKGKRIPGTGLGLNIVHKAVTALGGRVWVESKMDKDTLFLVRLPKRRKNG